MQTIVCKKCGYTWETNSQAKRISCSKCKTSITLPHNKIRLDESNPPEKPKKSTPPPISNSTNLHVDLDREIDKKQRTPSPPKPVVAAEEAAVRIVITANHFKALIKHMTKMHEENPEEPRYVIEYNTLTRELFVDIAEKEEMEVIPER